MAEKIMTIEKGADACCAEQTSPIAQTEIHTKVREIIDGAFKDRAGVKVLDAAAGNGHMSKWLHEKGFDVTALDLSTEKWRVKGVSCHACDLNRDIGLEGGSFDLIVSIETIEHLENPFHFIRELSRLAKKDGVIIITTPNVHSIRSRVKFFFTGLPTLFEYVKDDRMGQHITPVSIGQFLYAFERSGLKLAGVFSTGRKPSLPGSIALSLLDLPTMAGLRLLKGKRKGQPDFYLNVLSDDDVREMNRDVTLVVMARKIA